MFIQGALDTFHTCADSMPLRDNWKMLEYMMKSHYTATRILVYTFCVQLYE